MFTFKKTIEAEKFGLNLPATRSDLPSFDIQMLLDPQTHTYQVETSHTASGLTVLHIQEQEDVDGSQNKVEQSPSTSRTNNVSLLGHHPEGRTQPVYT